MAKPLVVLPVANNYFNNLNLCAMLKHILVNTFFYALKKVMKKIILFLLFILFSAISFSQTKKLSIQVRLPIQLDFQKAEIIFPLRTEIKKANTMNFGCDALLKYEFSKFSFHSGIGFFRNRFNIKRPYDHQALNIGVDSLPIGTYAFDYNYSLLRLPIGASFTFLENKKMNFNIGFDFLNNFSFKRRYNGRVPFEGANTVYNGFNYFGNSLNLFLSLSNKSFEVEPYVRIYNNYKKDRFLKENENEKITRYFDAIGLSIRYSFKL